MEVFCRRQKRDAKSTFRGIVLDNLREKERKLLAGTRRVGPGPAFGRPQSRNPEICEICGLAVTNPKVVFEELPNLYPKLAGFFVIGKLE